MNIFFLILFGVLSLASSIFESYNRYTNYTFMGSVFIKKLTTKFKDIQNAASQGKITRLFVGSTLELKQSVQYGSLSDEINKKMFSGYILIDFKLKMSRVLGVFLGVMTEPIILIAELSDGTHLSTILWSGVTKDVSDFLSTSASGGIPVEGNAKITYKNGFLVEAILDTLVFAAVLLYFVTKK